jgi:ribosome-binding protein aMBF1 (putative translation factor)
MCKDDFPAEEFREIGRNKTTGLPRRSSYCTRCHAAYKAEYYRLQRSIPAFSEQQKQRSRNHYRQHAGQAARKQREKRLKDARTYLRELQEAGFSVQQIADLIGSQKRTIDRWLAGTSFPMDKQVRKLRDLVDLIERVRADARERTTIR